MQSEFNDREEANNVNARSELAMTRGSANVNDALKDFERFKEPPFSSKAAEKGFNLEIPSEIAERLKSVKSGGQLSTKSGGTGAVFSREPMSLQLRRSDNWASVNQTQASYAPRYSAVE